MIEAGAGGLPVFVVDGGDFAWTAPGIPAQRRTQQQRKGQLQLDAFALVGIDAMVPGDGDLALGVDWLSAQASRTQAPLLAANLSCGGQTLFPPARTVERGGVTLGFVGVLPASLAVPDGCVVSPAAPAVQAAIDGFGPVDLIVALSHQGMDDDEALALAVPSIDLVVTGGTGAVWPDPRPLPGDALHLSSGSRGKKVGLATVTLVDGGAGFADADAPDRLRSKLERTRRRLASAESQRDLANDDATRARALDRIEHYQSEIERMDAELVAATGATPSLRHSVENELLGLTVSVADHPPTVVLLNAAKADIEAAADTATGGAATLKDGPYVGSQVCAGCHVGPAKDWAKTGHAHAWATLVQDKRSQDLDCYQCHSTGAFDPEGPQSPADVALPLQHVGCESCHGAGREHSRAPAQARLTRVPDEAVCTQCHDGVQDEGRFNFETYRLRVDHDATTGVPADDPSL